MCNWNFFFFKNLMFLQILDFVKFIPLWRASARWTFMATDWTSFKLFVDCFYSQIVLLISVLMIWGVVQLVFEGFHLIIWCGRASPCKAMQSWQFTLRISKKNPIFSKALQQGGVDAYSNWKEKHIFCLFLETTFKVWLASVVCRKCDDGKNTVFCNLSFPEGRQKLGWSLIGWY